MKSPTLVLVLLSSLLWGQPAFGQVNPIDSLDLYIPEIMKRFNSIGSAVAIVHEGQIIYNKGFGNKAAGENAPVNEYTQFGIGSISKSFTSLALAMLVDEGKVSWDDKVITYLPYFQLFDTIATQLITIRDLLTHQSGLKEISGGTLWYHSNLNRQEIIKKIRFLKPASDLRTEIAYQNIMYLVAAEIVESVANVNWSAFIQDRILTPLKMNYTLLSHASRMDSENICSPHIANEGFKIISVEQEKLDNMMPAGGIYSCAVDMAKYMSFLLNGGVVGSDTLISAHAFSEIFKPQVPYSQLPAPIHNEFTMYGLGWWLTPKNGHKIIDHSGGIDGMVSNLIMIDDKKFGIIVMTNTWPAQMMTYAITFNLIGSLLNDSDYLITSKYIENHLYNADSIQSAKNQQELASLKELNAKPSFPIQKYAGTYGDEMYGEIQITLTANKLNIEFSHTPLFQGSLVHWHHDTFLIDWVDPRVPHGLLDFRINADHVIEGFEINQTGLLDVDFSELNIERRLTK